MKAKKKLSSDGFAKLRRAYDRQRLEAFKAAVDRCTANGGQVLVLELNRLEKAALKLCAAKEKENVHQYAMSWIRSCLDCDMERLEDEAKGGTK